MKVFVTGGTGFIGSEFIDRISRTEHEVTCLVRKTSKVEKLRKAGVDLVYGDVTDKASVLEGMRGCDSAVHLANVYSFWAPDMKVFKDVNVDGTRNVMDSVLLSGLSKVVHVSTVGVYYGTHEELPEGSSPEDTEYYKAQKSEYTRTKYLADSICWDLFRRENLPLVMVYPGGVLGGGDPKPSGDNIKNIVKRYQRFYIFPETLATFVHVNDVAEAILRALEKPGNIGGRYPVGNETMTFKEFTDTVCEIAEIPSPKLTMPGALASAGAKMTTWLANTIKKPPILGLCNDVVGAFCTDQCFDGSMTKSELGFEYTPVREAIKEEVETIRSG